MSPAFAGCTAHRCEFDCILYREALSLPSSASLTVEEQDRVIAQIFKAARNAV
jgi:uncharacterized lipoprotein YbaY